MKITAIAVTDEHGVVHRWEGTVGYAHTGTAQRRGESPGAPSVPYGTTVDAHLLIPLEPAVPAPSEPTPPAGAVKEPTPDVEVDSLLRDDCGHHCFVQSPEPGIRLVTHCEHACCHGQAVIAPTLVKGNAP